MPRTAPLVDSRDLRLLAAQGLSMPDMARELGVTYLRVYRSVQLLGVDVPPAPRAQAADIVPRLVRGRRGKPSRCEQLLPQLQELAERGLNTLAISAELGVAWRTVQLWAAKHHISIQRGKNGDEASRSERVEKMASMFRQGLTLQKIGDKFGVSRERVRQVLRKHGVDANEGGQQKACAEKRSAAQAKRDARCLTRLGVTHAEYVTLRNAGGVHAFQQQRANAQKRGIRWSLTLAQWWGIWSASGKWAHRGRGKGKYVMSRIKDSGGYEVGNVHIQLATENSREAVAQWNGKPKANRGVHCLYPGAAKPYLVKVAKRSIGYFATEDEAVAARMAYIAANGLTLRPNGQIGAKGRATPPITSTP